MEEKALEFFDNEEARVTEELKAQDQMKWVGLMNNLKQSAEEIIQNELIFN